MSPCAPVGGEPICNETRMANSICQVLLTDTPLAVPGGSLPAEVGGIVDFWGVVRRTEDGASIAGIEYEAHRTMAEHQLRAIAEEGTQSFTLMQLTVLHRVGFVPVGEASLLVRVCSRHRAEAFRASAWIVDELKKRVPIWKRPRFIATGAEASEVTAVTNG